MMWSEEVKDLYDNQQYCDVTINICNQEEQMAIMAHKLVLITESELFMKNLHKSNEWTFTSIYPVEFVLQCIDGMYDHTRLVFYLDNADLNSMIAIYSISCFLESKRMTNIILAFIQCHVEELNFTDKEMFNQKFVKDIVRFVLTKNNNSPVLSEDENKWFDGMSEYIYHRALNSSDVTFVKQFFDEFLTDEELAIKAFVTPFVWSEFENLLRCLLWYVKAKKMQDNNEIYNFLKTVLTHDNLWDIKLRFLSTFNSQTMSVVCNFTDSVGGGGEGKIKEEFGDKIGRLVITIDGSDEEFNERLDIHELEQILQNF